MTRYRIVQDHALYFVTFSVVEWLPVFVREESCRMITDSFNFCQEHKHLRINAYVIMPTHLHAMLFDEDFDPDRLQQTLTDLRKFTGSQLVGYCTTHMPACFARTLRAASGKDRQHRFWQAGIHPEAIYTQSFWQQKLDYLHDNPCRKGLVREANHWRHSSAAHWLEGVESDIALTSIGW
jgi:REP element-mobilizing transposase RayT